MSTNSTPPNAHTPNQSAELEQLKQENKTLSDELAKIQNSLYEEKNKLAKERFNNEIEALKHSKKVLEEQIKTLTDQSKIVKGLTEPLEGTITTDEKTGYFIELVAHEALLTATVKAAQRIEELLGVQEEKNILIVHSRALLELKVVHQMVKRQLERWSEALDEKLKPQAGAGEEEKTPAPSEQGFHWAGLATKALGAAGAISAVMDALRFFNADHNIISRETDVKLLAVQAKMLGLLSRHDHFNIYLENFLLDDGPGKNAILERLTEVLDKKRKLQEELSLPNIPGERRKEIEEMIQRFDGFYRALLTIPEGKTHSSLAQAIIQEQVQAKKITHILFLNIGSNGGEAVVKRGLLSFINSRIQYLGGGVLNYVLANKEGAVITADSLVERSRQVYYFSS